MLKQTITNVFHLRCNMVSCPGKCIPIKKFCRQAKAEIQEAIQKVRQYYWKYKSANKKLEEMKLNMKSKEKWKKLTKKVKSLKTKLNKYAQSYSQSSSPFKEECRDGESIYLVVGLYCGKWSAKIFKTPQYDCIQLLADAWDLELL